MAVLMVVLIKSWVSPPVAFIGLPLIAAVIAIILTTFVAHLDGSGATTFLIVVPAFLPIIGVVAPFGVSAQAVAATFLLTATFGTPVSPSVAAVYVGLGLADVTIGDHIKYSLKFVWPMSILTLIASTLLGVIPF